MNLAVALLAFVLALAFALVGVSRVGAWVIERRNPPVGAFETIDGARIHHVFVPAGEDADLPPVVFIHGASGNLLDQMIPMRPLLEGRGTLLFFDRPGHGWSQRGTGNGDPYGQARTLAKLMDRLGIPEAIIVGHSFGGAVAAAFALEHPEKTRGLVFLSAATHPWPGGDTAWYYRLAATPVIGRIFVETLAWPGGMLSIEQASASVFSPNPVPEAYLDDAAISLVLRPGAFRWNAVDVAGLYDHVKEAAKRYSTIATPTVVVTGDCDAVVYEEIHSGGLARDIAGSQLIVVHNLGHKPEWVAPDLVFASIEAVAGMEVDLRAVAETVEARIADDDAGSGTCGKDAPELAVP